MELTDEEVAAVRNVWIRSAPLLLISELPTTLLLSKTFF